jgi:putative transposase
MRYSDHSYRHGVAWNICHVQWVTKYRYRVFSDVKLKNLLLILLVESSKRFRFQILELEIQPEHVHALVALRPSMSPSRALQMMKGYSSRLLFLLEEKSLSQWYSKTKRERSLWGDGKFMSSVGHITLEKAKEYMKKQEAHHAKEAIKGNPHPLGLGRTSIFERTVIGDAKKFLYLLISMRMFKIIFIGW